MRVTIITCLFISLSFNTFSQDAKKMQRAWIRISTEYQPGANVPPDTGYRRLTVTKNKVYFSSTPAWDSNLQQDWSLKNNILSLMVSNYKVEELTDTSLIIAEEGFSRIKFLAEEYLASRDSTLTPAGEWNNKPFYIATDLVTPRYIGKEDFSKYIDDAIKGFSIPKKSLFKVTFIVTEDGKVENPQIVSSILDSFDAQAIAQIIKTSGKWRPASLKGKPIATRISYHIQYLDKLKF